MPPAQASSWRSSPMPSPSIRRAASSKETSVKTAIEKEVGGRSEPEDVPDALADRAPRRLHALGKFVLAAADDDLVAGCAALGIDRHLLQLAAHPQLFDVGTTVLDDGALDDGVLALRVGALDRARNPGLGRRRRCRCGVGGIGRSAAQ